MLDINTLRFEVQLNKMDNSQLILSPLVAEDLLDRLEAAEKEIESWKGLAQQFGQEADAAKAEVEALRAKVEATEQQEPVAWLHETRRDSDVVTDAVKHVWGKVVVGALAEYSIPLYLAPGAKGK